MSPSGPMNKFSGALFLIFFCLLLPDIADSQCCSTGSPSGASEYMGVLGKNYFRLATFYRHSFSDTYYESDSYADNNPLKSANYNFGGLTLGYGITRRLTVEIDFGYFMNKTQLYLNTKIPKQTGFGFSNSGVTLKYGLFVKPTKQIELTAGAGFRYPFTRDPQMVDNVQLNRDIQPSTNAFGINGMLFFSIGFPSVTMRVFSINRYDYNFFDKTDLSYPTLYDYKYGNILLNSVFVSKKIVKYLFAIVQFRNEYKTNDNKRLKETGEVSNQVNTGYDIFYVSPQLSYSIVGKWNVSVVFDQPLYKNYKGHQLTPAYSYAISLTRDFNLGHKAPKVEPAKVDSH